MTRVLELSFADLGVTRETVRRECGGVGEELAATLDATIEALLAEVPAHVEPRAGYVFTTERFDPGPIVADHLEGAERFAAFLATLGPGFDAWSRGLFAEGDPFRGFVADAIGSVAVEAAVDRVCEEIAADAGADGVSNRVSPGYCGWNVADQHRLFRVFPESFLGVRLTASALMVPLKSVSGIVGIGPGVELRDYPCGECGIEDCPTGRGRCA
ncbi:MAG: 5-methyltetrahydrofolate--homocysteine methyltransferase [Planctomycetota bacterium]